MRPDLSHIFQQIKSIPINWQKKYFTAIMEHDADKIKWLNQERGYKSEISRLQNEIKKMKR